MKTKFDKLLLTKTIGYVTVNKGILKRNSECDVFYEIVIHKEDTHYMLFTEEEFENMKAITKVMFY